MKRLLYFVSITIGTLSFLTSCGNAVTPSKQSDNAHLETEQTHQDEIIFPASQAQAIGMQTEIIKSAPFREVISASGQILPALGDEVTLVATVSGIVTLPSSILAGAQINTGSTLFKISSRAVGDGDAIDKIKIEYDIAQREFLRAQNLIKDKIISVKNFNAAEQRFRTAQAAYKGFANSYTAGSVAVAAPFTGYVKSVFVSQGEYVAVGQPVVTLSQNKRLQLRAQVPHAYFKSLAAINDANFRLSYSDENYSLSALNGKVASFAKTVEQGNAFLPLTLEFDNQGDILPGSFVSVYLLGTERKDVISVPKAAVIEEQGTFFVFKKLDEEGYAKLEVKIGMDNGKRIEILHGISSGDEIVTKGAYRIRLAQSSAVIPEGHSH